MELQLNFICHIYFRKLEKKRLSVISNQDCLIENSCCVWMEWSFGSKKTRMKSWQFDNCTCFTASTWRLLLLYRFAWLMDTCVSVGFFTFLLSSASQILVTGVASTWLDWDTVIQGSCRFFKTPRDFQIGGRSFWRVSWVVWNFETFPNHHSYSCYVFIMCLLCVYHEFTETITWDVFSIACIATRGAWHMAERPRCCQKFPSHLFHGKAKTQVWKRPTRRVVDRNARRCCWRSHEKNKFMNQQIILLCTL